MVKIEKIKKNKIRKLGKRVKPCLSWLKGTVYVLLHFFIMFAAGVILLFDNNVIHLLILFNITVLDGITCVFLHDCPLTILEQKYLKKSIVGEHTKNLKKLGILYNRDGVYEKTIEFIINACSFTVGKIMALLLYNSFQHWVKKSMVC